MKNHGGDISRLNSAISKLSIDHSFLVNHNPAKATKAAARLTKMRQELLLHEGAVRLSRQVESMERKLKTLDSKSKEATQLRLLMQTKKALIRKINSRL